MSIAEAHDMPVARKRLVPPSPPRAPDNMTAFGRIRAIRVSPIGSWSQRAYEEDIVQGRFFGRSTFILNAMCWSTITRIIRVRRPASGCCVRCSAKVC